MGKILLTGYMGSGKSSVATALGKITGLQTIELDREIEKSFGVLISEIFDTHGEIAFRKREGVILRSLMCRPDEFILSLGGGTPCYGDNAKFLSFENSVSVYLYASVSELTSRLLHDISRPLLKTVSIGQRTEFIAKHLFERTAFYAQANLKIDTTGKNPDEIAQEIVGQLKKA